MSRHQSCSPPPPQQHHPKRSARNYNYYAVRRGNNNLTKCIFLNWSDCQLHVVVVLGSSSAEENEVEYQGFDDLHQAINYLEYPLDDYEHHEEAQEGGIADPLVMVPQAAAVAAAHKRPLPTKQNNNKALPRSSLDSLESSNPRPRKRDPTQKWVNTYSQLEEYHRENGNINVPINHSLYKWIQEQWYQYKKLQEGHSTTTMFQVKIDKMTSLGMDWENPTHDSNNKATSVGVAKRNWEAQFAELMNYYNQHGDSNVPMGHILYPWIQEQIYQYHALPNKKSAVRSNSNYNVSAVLSQEKIERLQEWGIDFGNQPHPAMVYWEASYQALEEYFKEHGNVNDKVVSMTDPILFAWIQEQRDQYRRLKEDQPTTMFQSKITRLERLGVEWADTATRSSSKVKVTTPSITPQKKRAAAETTATARSPKRAKHTPSPAAAATKKKAEPKARSPTKQWESAFEQLQDYKTQHGNLNVTKEESLLLYKWILNQRSDYKNYRGSMSEEKIQRLEQLGFDWSGRDHAVIWEEMYQQLQAYTRAHGDSNVPSEPKTELSAWVQKQRLLYREIGYKQTKKGSAVERGDSKRTLTAVQLQRLTELSFVFRLRKAGYVSWEERIEQCQQFVHEHGHLKIPKTHPLLGPWSCKERFHYKEYLERKTSSLNPEKIKQLEDLGFVFEAGKRITIKKRMPWSERLQELLEYKEEHGHTRVPQACPELGGWVKQQRKEYKLMVKNEPSTMTPQRFTQLSNVGFEWDATKFRGALKRSTDCDDSSC
jgi:hypothetical protein